MSVLLQDRNSLKFPANTGEWMTDLAPLVTGGDVRATVTLFRGGLQAVSAVLTFPFTDSDLESLVIQTTRGDQWWQFAPDSL